MKRENPDSFLHELRQILPAKAVLTAEEELRPYECDGLCGYRELPRVVVLPDQVTQVQAILALCQRHRVPVVARGAGTGLSGGATPHSEGLLLSMTRFNRILAVDPVSCTARVQPGVRNLAVSEAVAAYGLYYAPDPSSEIACTIGGNVAENAGGVHCLKYGLTVHNVLAAEVLLMGGESIRVGSEGLTHRDTIYLPLLRARRGMLGVVTEVTLRLLPQPEGAKLLLARFRHHRDCCRRGGPGDCCRRHPGGIGDDG